MVSDLCYLLFQQFFFFTFKFCIMIDHILKMSICHFEHIDIFLSFMLVELRLFSIGNA